MIEFILQHVFPQNMRTEHHVSFQTTYARTQSLIYEIIVHNAAAIIDMQHMIFIPKLL
jgi:hypothetical protein